MNGDDRWCEVERERDVRVRDADRGHELAVYVHPGHHRQRVGRRLVESALPVAGGEGIERVGLLTMGDYAMLALALGRGFEVTDQAAGQVEMALTHPGKD